MSETSIEWTDKTWNPVTGCSKQSEGCQNCYAETMTIRLQSMRINKYSNGFVVTLHPESIEEPLKWKKPKNIFVCSMSDLFHPKVPYDFIDKILDTIIKTPQHRYQILTKRPERMMEYFVTRKVPDNVWLGTTIENKNYTSRIEILKRINSKIHFLSCEPLIGDLGDINLSGIDWIIVGGESGVRARPMKEEWVYNLKKLAEKYNVKFFFKQWGTWGPDGIRRSKKKNGKLLEGKIIQEMPF